MVVDAANVAHETKVVVGIRTADKIEIDSGLLGGETVVIVGNYALPDGTKVEVAEEKPEAGQTPAAK
jgi:multidrug efflux pump subunit AcrA (membrane-fusion protein)